MSARHIAVMFALAVSAASGAARAQPSPTEAQKAVTIGREAKEAYDRGEWGPALVLFETAEQKAHSPVLLLYIARCHRNLGRLVKARDVYRQVVAETLAPNAPPPFVSAKADAAKDLEALEPRIASLSVDVSAIPADASIEIDGAPRPRADLAGLAMDPGVHVVRALSPGGELLAEQRVEVPEGGEVAIELKGAQPLPGPPPGVSRPTPPGPATEVAPTPGSLAPGISVLAVGVLGLGAGIGTRVVAFQKVDEVRGRCEGDRCLPEDEDEIALAKSLEIASTVCFVAGGVASAVGVTLIIVRPGGTTGGAAASVQVRPNWVGVVGSF